jgi:putative transposase
MHNKAYKLRLYPNKVQEELLQKHFGHCRFIYNHFLEVKIKHYKETKKTITWVDLANQLPKLKEELQWLHEIGSQSLQQSIINLDKAYTAFFRSGSGFPKFKSKHKSKNSFIVPITNNNIKIDYDKNKLTIPKFKYGIKCEFHRQIPTDEKIKTATISQNRDGKYYVSILVEIDKELPTKPALDRNKAIGIDFGVKTFLTFNDGQKINNPKFLEKSLDKLKKHQQELELITDKKSIKYKSKRELITKLHSKIARQRKDFLDKLTYKVSHDNQVDTICIENLSIKDILEKNYSPMNLKVSDNAWGMFVNMLQYKSDWYGKNLRKIGRFEPSSKTCSECGHVNHDLKREDMGWKCKKCDCKHDRDINAAKNILDFSLPDTFFLKGRNYPIEAQPLKQLGNSQAMSYSRQIKSNVSL